MNVFRSPHNPIISPENVKPSRADFEVVCVFNAGVIRYDDEVILLLRVAERPVNTDAKVGLVPVYDKNTGKIEIKKFSKENPQNDFTDARFVRTPTEQYLSSLSHVRLARSTDGIIFDIEEKPAIKPENEYEAFGVEDPRITSINNSYYITYSAVSPLGSMIGLASTKDFKSYTRHGIIFCPDNRDVEIFPEKINDKYYALHRPNSGEYNKREIWIAESSDLLSWGNHRRVMGIRENYWDDGRVGGSAVPIKVNDGWLEIYHGADKNNRYCLGAVLLDVEKPWKVLARSQFPILQPEMDYEINGFFGQVVFNCGVLLEGDLVKIYYGAADTSLCYAETAVGDILKSLKY